MYSAQSNNVKSDAPVQCNDGSSQFIHTGKNFMKQKSDKTTAEQEIFMLGLHTHDRALKNILDIRIVKLATIKTSIPQTSKQIEMKRKQIQFRIVAIAEQTSSQQPGKTSTQKKV